MLIYRNMIWLAGLIVVSSGSLLLIINGLRKAPEAFEDENGFHIVRPRRSSAGVLRKKKSAATDQGARHSWDSPVSHSP
jgi:hypothetical protein